MGVDSGSRGSVWQGHRQGRSSRGAAVISHVVGRQRGKSEAGETGRGPKGPVYPACQSV